MAPQKDKLLFTPGPLTTSGAVKEAMLRDVGSRDAEFIKVVRDIRQHLLGVAGVSQADGYEAILLQGSGTFGIEAVVSSVIPRDGKLLIVINGAYGNVADAFAVGTVDDDQKFSAGWNDRRNKRFNPKGSASLHQHRLVTACLADPGEPQQVFPDPLHDFDEFGISRSQIAQHRLLDTSAGGERSGSEQ